MPDINRIRVNNVKYNFGTQFYDDFTMRMYGKNTLYDLANGGGKSVLMLLLLQNMIPNCTLDEKQPIEKLFRTGNGNTTIHSLIEWRLDDTDNADGTVGYRYMTTGFCARKAKEENEGAQDREVASVEYFNYCIFYREYNKNDIINLPLVKDGERMTYQGLRAYLKELPHRDMSLRVEIFDRKGEYQRFISGYGLHESQWEIIRGINKTEGHVRTYFENNYKTTRKVVEDLLIEEIIEKAYMVKTELDEDGADSMARMLMDIKEQLTVLAKKKKDIAGYEHQTELLSVLRDKVSSFLSIYEEQGRLSKSLADICVTGELLSKEAEQKTAELSATRDEKLAQKDKQKRYIESLKITRDKRTLDGLKEEADRLAAERDAHADRIERLKQDLALKESISDYLLYIADRKKYCMHEAAIKNIMQESSFDEELMYTYVYNIKMRTDVAIADIRRQLDELTDETLKTEAEYAYHDKLLSEARTRLEVVRSSKKNSEDEIVALSKTLSEIRMSMSEISFTQFDRQQEECEKRLYDLENEIKESEKLKEETVRLLNDARLAESVLERKKQEASELVASLEKREKEFKEADEKLSGIARVYGCGDSVEQAGKALSNRIAGAIIEIEKLKRDEDNSKKRIERLKEGRLIDISAAAEKVISYIETRHGARCMYGMDYISALPDDMRGQVLSANPELPYGVITEAYEDIRRDENILSVDTDGICINLYDMDRPCERGMYFGDNAFAVHKSIEQLENADTVNDMIRAEEERLKEIALTLETKREVLSTYRQDEEFVYKTSAGELLEAKNKLDCARLELENSESELAGLAVKIKEYVRSIASEIERTVGIRKEYDECLKDTNRLYTIGQLSEIIDKNEDNVRSCDDEIKRLEKEINDLGESSRDDDSLLKDKRALISTLKKRLDDINADWDNNYKAYYNIDREYDVLTLTDNELYARFTAMVSEENGDRKSVEDKKLLMDTLSASLERCLRGIEKRGVDIKTLDDLEARGLLYEANEEVFASVRQNIDDTAKGLSDTEDKLKKKESQINRLEGSIEYAVSCAEAAFGSYEETDAPLSEIVQNLENGGEVLKRLENEAAECEKELKRYLRQQGYMVDLYKDVKRIITTNGISLDDAKPIEADDGKLRESFENTLLLFDKNSKTLERAKNDMLKFKGSTAAALDEAGACELAATIRNDAVIPDDAAQAGELIDSLASIIDYIRLEKDRVSKGLVDMETIKNNFEEQCLQRCLDVRTELDKLPKLSRIVMDGETIQMVGLSIPYVKDEFLKQRMSDYIDKLVAAADGYDNDRERMKYIRASLSLKKLFGVIVTDMNAIKLSLYKRERIKEQSRYLKYEEAVGSTGQSQGIYIQFLIAIINYISGMYSFGTEGVRTKTIFIDNPFGAAKDIYIWEPIFAMLKANNVQLIVPARGATPAITGRFDVNYILGQQMSGGRQLTVVTDYTSSVNQDELEYRELSYEQVSFDFI